LGQQSLPPEQRIDSEAPLGTSDVRLLQATTPRSRSSTTTALSVVGCLADFLRATVKYPGQTRLATLGLLANTFYYMSGLWMNGRRFFEKMKTSSKAGRIHLNRSSSTKRGDHM
jgi:hypothetical protein